MSLYELYTRDRGKYSDKWEHYIAVYEDLFSNIQNMDIDILEIGVQNGGSLEALASYFANARTITGVDIDPKCGQLAFADPRIKVVIGDASTERTAAEVAAIASNLDLAIDDGSHKSSDIILSFLLYFPKVRNGGLYIVEDLHCSYFEQYEGGLFHPYSSMAFFKLLADAINIDHWGVIRPGGICFRESLTIIILGWTRRRF